MKFKADFTDHGLRILEKGVLPTLEKFGKTVQLLLGPEDLHLLQTGINTDGPHTTARLAHEAIFEPDTLKVQSKHHNLIAFSLDLALLSRVLRAAGANDADLLEVKLAMRNVATEIDKLNQEKDLAQLCPYYVNLQGEVPRLQGMVDKSKGISSMMTLVTTKGGAIHIQVDGGSVQLACEMQGLQVFPASVADTAIGLTAPSAEGRLKEAGQKGQSASVCMLAKHFGKSLQGSLLTQPAQLLCGIGENLGYVHLLYVFRNPLSEAGYDDNMSLSLKLPVRDD